MSFLLNLAAVAVFWGVKANCTFSRWVASSEFRKACVAVTMEPVWAVVADADCAVAPLWPVIVATIAVATVRTEASSS
jgi:hypothetical protein